MKIKILAEAEQDLLDGVLFYNRQSPGVGRRFCDSLAADIESLHVCASVHAKQYGFYQMNARRFPYAIFYRVEGDIIEIYAVLDCRRDPEWIQDRLTRQ